MHACKGWNGLWEAYRDDRPGTFKCLGFLTMATWTAKIKEWKLGRQEHAANLGEMHEPVLFKQAD